MPEWIEFVVFWPTFKLNSISENLLAIWFSWNPDLFSRDSTACLVIRTLFRSSMVVILFVWSNKKKLASSSKQLYIMGRFKTKYSESEVIVKTCESVTLFRRPAVISACLIKPGSKSVVWISQCFNGLSNGRYCTNFYDLFIQVTGHMVHFGSLLTLRRHYVALKGKYWNG